MTLSAFFSGRSFKRFVDQPVPLRDERVFRKFRMSMLYWSAVGLPMAFLLHFMASTVHTFFLSFGILSCAVGVILYFVSKGKEKMAKSTFAWAFALCIICLEVFSGQYARGSWLVISYLLLLYAHFHRIKFFATTLGCLALFLACHLFEIFGTPIYPVAHSAWYDLYLGTATFVYFSLLGRVHMQGIEQAKANARSKRQELEVLNSHLLHHQTALERANRELHQFASCASHDMREPLRTISSFSSLVKNRLPAEDKNRELLEFVTDGAKRMTILLDDLISYTRVTQIVHKKEWTDLNQAMVEVQKNLFLKIAESEATIDLMPMPFIQAERTHMVLLFQNLLSNAIKYASPDRKPHISVKWISVDEGITIIVRDNGIGIEAKYLTEIFEPFRRLHPIGKYEGSGIGLATCRKIIEYYHGSDLSADSEYGFSTTITIHLRAPIKTAAVKEGVALQAIPEYAI